MIIYSLKYYTKYNQIVKHYKDLDLQKSGELYTESHHIIPKSMGGDNSKENLVRVPARVHFLLHWMLYRIYRTSSLANAWNSMRRDKHGNRYKSKSFDYIKTAICLFQKGQTPWNKGISPTAESRLKMSMSHIGQVSPNKGKILSDKTKAKIAMSGKDRITSEDTKQKLSLSLRGKKLSNEHKEKISQNIKSTPEITCPYCSKTGNHASMHRWHFDNCRYIIT